MALNRPEAEIWVLTTLLVKPQKEARKRGKENTHHLTEYLNHVDRLLEE